MAVFIKNGNGVFRVTLYSFYTVRNDLMICQIRIGCDYQIRKICGVPGNDQILKIDGTIENFVFIDNIYGHDVVVFTCLLYQLLHGGADIQILLNDYIIRSHSATNLIIFIRLDHSDLFAGLFFHVIDDRLCSLIIHVFENIYGIIRIHVLEEFSGEICGETCQEFMRGFHICKNLRKFFFSEYFIYSLKSIFIEIIQCARDIIIMIVREFLCNLFVRQTALEQFDYLLLIISFFGCICHYFLFIHRSLLKKNIPVPLKRDTGTYHRYL